MLSIQSPAFKALTFLFLTFLISWSLIVGGYCGGLVEGPWVALILALSMVGPGLSALFCIHFFECGLRGLKSVQWIPHFRRSTRLWWFYAWLIPVLLIVISMGLTLLFAPNVSLRFTFNGIHIGPLTLLQALFLAPLINTPILTFTEELGWRGYLYDLWRPFGFWVSALATGCVWGLWHAPAIFLYGLNYSEHPIMGIALFMIWCALLSPMITLVREKTGSVWAAGLFHGTINALGGVSVLMLGDPAFPWRGVLGLGGFCALIFGVIGVVLIKYASEGTNRSIKRPGTSRSVWSF